MKKEVFCRHDYKNAIQIGNVDYVCPLCKNLLDPLEWFLMNSFEFVEVKCSMPDVEQKVGDARKNLEKRLNRSIVSKKNFKTLVKHKALK